MVSGNARRVKTIDDVAVHWLLLKNCRKGWFRIQQVNLKKPISDKKLRYRWRGGDFDGRFQVGSFNEILAKKMKKYQSKCIFHNFALSRFYYKEHIEELARCKSHQNYKTVNWDLVETIQAALVNKDDI